MDNVGESEKEGAALRIVMLSKDAKNFIPRVTILKEFRKILLGEIMKKKEKNITENV